ATQLYTLSLHDALPISADTRSARSVPSVSATARVRLRSSLQGPAKVLNRPATKSPSHSAALPTIFGYREWRNASRCPRPISCIRSEEHTSELQSLAYLV